MKHLQGRLSTRLSLTRSIPLPEETVRMPSCLFNVCMPNTTRRSHGWHGRHGRCQQTTNTKRKRVSICPSACASGVRQMSPKSRPFKSRLSLAQVTTIEIRRKGVLRSAENHLDGARALSMPINLDRLSDRRRRRHWPSISIERTWQPESVPTDARKAKASVLSVCVY